VPGISTPNREFEYHRLLLISSQTEMSGLRVNQKDFIAKRWGVLASSCSANSHEAPLVPDLMSGTQ
jgi:hypothetical protein